MPEGEFSFKEFIEKLARDTDKEEAEVAELEKLFALPAFGENDG